MWTFTGSSDATTRTSQRPTRRGAYIRVEGIGGQVELSGTRLRSNDPIVTAPTTLTWASRISASGQSRGI